MEGMVKVNFWQGKKVLITGHTGFKGSWLSLMLHDLGANVTGYALAPNTEPSMFVEANIGSKIKNIIGDINDLDGVRKVFEDSQPEIVLHLAAQPLVRDSYDDPVLTYKTNVIGLVNVLEVLRITPSAKVFLNVTTDKCYENIENFEKGYVETDPMGGYDPYSASKGCAELVTSSYRRSFFNPEDYGKFHNTSVATARAGNVIGGGDWSKDRLLPDIFRSISTHHKLVIRNPDAIRPWQHVLEPLSGYMMLAEKMWFEPTNFAEAFNFGPEIKDAISVGDIVKKLNYNNVIVEKNKQPHEAHFLKLNINKAREKIRVDSSIQY